MEKWVKRFAEWLVSKTDQGAKIKGELDRCVAMLAGVREQYRKFGMLSPTLQFEINKIIDEVRGGIGKLAEDEIKRRFDVSIDEIDVVARRDYESLRGSHHNLLLLVASYQIKIAAAEAEEQKGTTEV